MNFKPSAVASPFSFLLSFAFPSVISAVLLLLFPPPSPPPPLSRLSIGQISTGRPKAIPGRSDRPTDHIRRWDSERKGERGGGRGRSPLLARKEHFNAPAEEKAALLQADTLRRFRFILLPVLPCVAIDAWHLSVRLKPL
jgi:hypothetical protein